MSVEPGPKNSFLPQPPPEPIAIEDRARLAETQRALLDAQTQAGQASLSRDGVVAIIKEHYQGVVPFNVADALGLLEP